MKKILAVFLFTILLGSCNSRVDLGFSPNSTEEETAEVTFTGLISGFQQGNLKTYPTDAAAKMKHRINFNGIRIVLYSVDESNPTQPDKVAYVFDKDIKAVAGNFAGNDYAPSMVENNGETNFRIKGKEKIKVGNYLVYYFTSCNDQLKEATSVGKPFSEITGALNYDSQKDFDRGRLLNNIYVSSDPIKISESLFHDNAINKTYELPAAKLTAINAILSVMWKNVVKDERYEIIDDFIYVYPDVQNLKYYLFPKADEHLQSKLQVYYPIDPNYGGLASKSLEELKNEFMYYTEKHILAISSHNPDYISSYILLPENTVASSETSAKVITRVILLVRMLPKSLKSQLTPTQIKNEKLGWVDYNGKQYIDTDFLQIYKSLVNKASHTDQEKAFLAAGKRIMKSGSNELKLWGYEDDEIKYYHCSYSFFTFPITHSSLDALGGTTDNGGYFGVVRNHHYQYMINSFSTIGITTPRNFSYDLDYLSDRFISSSCEIGDMKEIINEIEEL